MYIHIYNTIFDERMFCYLALLMIFRLTVDKKILVLYSFRATLPFTSFLHGNGEIETQCEFKDTKYIHNLRICSVKYHSLMCIVVENSILNALYVRRIVVFHNLN